MHPNHSIPSLHSVQLPPLLLLFPRSTPPLFSLQKRTGFQETALEMCFFLLGCLVCNLFR